MEFFKGPAKVIALHEMVKYKKTNVKLSDSQLSKLKTAVRNQTGLTFRMNIKIFAGNELHHELLFITRQKTNLRNAFEDNLLPDIKLSKTQIKSGGFLKSLNLVIFRFIIK